MKFFDFVGETIEVKPISLLGWLLGLGLLVNTGLNVAVLYSLSSVYSWDDYKPDFVVRLVKNKIEADNTKVPPIKVIKFISAYAYRPTQIAFTGESLYVFIKFDLAIELNEEELEAVVAHEIGHYELGHLDFKPALYYSETFETEDSNKRIEKEVQADLFAIKYSNKQAMSSAIKKMVWDDNEKNIRLAALNIN